MPNILTRAPRWAWYTAAGVGLAGGAIQLYRRREERTAALAGTADAGTGTGGSGTTVGIGPSPAPGVVVPPVIIPNQQTDPLAGVQPLQELYIGAVSSVIGDYKDLAAGWGNVYAPLIQQNQSLTNILAGGFQSTQDALLALATAGPPPAATIQTPVFAAPALPAPAAPAPACPAAFPEGAPPQCYRTITPQDCHCEGTGAARKCWTRRLHDHQYQDGHVVTVSVDKVKDGC